MDVIDKLLNGDRRGRLWFFLVLFPSFLPVTLSALSALKIDPVPEEFNGYVKINDLVFSGMTLCISSLNILLGEEAKERKVGIMALAMSLTILLSNFFERNATAVPTVATLIAVLAFVTLSVVISFLASRSYYSDITNFNPKIP